MHTAMEPVSTHKFPLSPAASGNPLLKIFLWYLGTCAMPKQIGTWICRSRSRLITVLCPVLPRLKSGAARFAPNGQNKTAHGLAMGGFSALGGKLFAVYGVGAPSPPGSPAGVPSPPGPPAGDPSPLDSPAGVPSPPDSPAGTLCCWVAPQTVQVLSWVPFPWSTHGPQLCCTADVFETV